ncbi:MAG TPA: ATP-binding protein [Candidatus Sulfotelmatobacter sp.]|nr:ATP-binding protein [Candidatus Sulfotelmatobacter sp.]
MPEFIFDRDEEQQGIRERLSKGKPFLLHGPSGVGKTLLLRNVLKEFPAVLYCENSTTTQTVFRTFARQLLQQGNARLRKAFREAKAIESKSAVSLKGIVLDALREGKYAIMLDHIKCPSHSFAAVVREIRWTSTQVSAVAQSSHMEDVGFLQPFYSDRSEKYEIRNLDNSAAEQFVHEMIRRTGLAAPNLSEFVGKVLEFSAGNPGAIVSLIRMAKYPKYRTDEHIKITPLYIDFRMNWGAVR